MPENMSYPYATILPINKTVEKKEIVLQELKLCFIPSYS